MANKKIALFDRDGTLIKEPAGERLIREQDIELYPDTVEALSELNKNGFSIIIITNQAGVSEGLITIEEFNRLHQIVLDQLAPSSIEVLKTYVCPHGPKDNCNCRKPNTKMFEDAARDFGFDLKKVFMVGDRESDIKAAKNVGAKSIFLNTGLQEIESGLADYEVGNLLQAVNIILTK